MKTVKRIIAEDIDPSIRWDRVSDDELRALGFPAEWLKPSANLGTLRVTHIDLVSGILSEPKK